jgi:hypothetical protein
MEKDRQDLFQLFRGQWLPRAVIAYGALKITGVKLSCSDVR